MPDEIWFLALDFGPEAGETHAGAVARPSGRARLAAATKG